MRYYDIHILSHQSNATLRFEKHMIYSIMILCIVEG